MSRMAVVRDVSILEIDSYNKIRDDITNSIEAASSDIERLKSELALEKVIGIISSHWSILWLSCC